MNSIWDFLWLWSGWGWLLKRVVKPIGGDGASGLWLIVSIPFLPPSHFVSSRWLHKLKFSWIKPEITIHSFIKRVGEEVFPQNRWLGSEQLWLQLNLSRAWSTVLVCDNLTFRWLIGLQLIANYLSFNEPTKDATIVTVLLLWDTKLVHFKNLIGMDQGCLNFWYMWFDCRSRELLAMKVDWKHWLLHDFDLVQLLFSVLSLNPLHADKFSNLHKVVCCLVRI